MASSRACSCGVAATYLRATIETRAIGHAPAGDGETLDACMQIRAVHTSMVVFGRLLHWV